MAGNPIPSLLINAAVYEDGDERRGAGDVEISDLEYMTESLTGLGLAGEVDIPVLGHFASLTLKIKWNVVNKDSARLLEPKSHNLAIYGSIQEWNADAGTFAAKGCRIMCKATPKKSGIGTFEPAKKMEPESEFEITYLKMSIDGDEIIEIDKINFICRVNGTDYLADVRSQLGK